MKKRTAALVLILSLLLLLITVPGFAAANTALILSVPNRTVLLGETVQVTVFNQDFDTITEGLIWESSAPHILSVDSNGSVTAHTKGAATIYATDSEGVTGSVYLMAAEFSLSSPTYTPYVGQTVQISVTALPGWQDSNPLEWSSSDESVATVDQSGLVTCHAEGRTYISALPPNGNGQILTLTVTQRIRISSVELSFPLVIPMNSSKLITFQATDYDLEDLTVTADDSNVVSVSILPSSFAYYLLIQGKAPGSTRVTIRGSEGDTLSIDVVVPSLTVSRDTPSYLPLLIGNSLQFYAKDGSGDPVEVTWSSEDPLIASVDQNGLVTGLDYGQTRIIATDSAGVQVHSSITVLPFEITDRSGCDALRVGETTTLTLNVAPGWENRIRFSSSDPTVAQVDDRGQITGLKAGTAVIEISTDVSEAADLRCSVTVVEPVFEGTLDNGLQWSYDLNAGSLTFTGEFPVGCTVYTAVYNDEGRLLDVILFTAPDTAFFETDEQPDALRLFLLDGDYTALCGKTEQAL